MLGSVNWHIAPSDPACICLLLSVWSSAHLSRRRRWPSSGPSHTRLTNQPAPHACRHACLCASELEKHDATHTHGETYAGSPRTQSPRGEAPSHHALPAARVATPLTTRACPCAQLSATPTWPLRALDCFEVVGVRARRRRASAKGFREQRAARPPCPPRAPTPRWLTLGACDCSRSQFLGSGALSLMGCGGSKATGTDDTRLVAGAAKESAMRPETDVEAFREVRARARACPPPPPPLRRRPHARLGSRRRSLSSPRPSLALSLSRARLSPARLAALCPVARWRAEALRVGGPAAHVRRGRGPHRAG